MRNFNSYKKHLIIGGLILFIILTFISYLYIDKKDNNLNDIALEETTMKLTNEVIYVDVKGAVKNPGVYEFEVGERVLDAVKRAGGLAKNGSTSNVNLSKKLANEMVVYIYTAAEIKKGSNNISCNTTCNCETLEVNNCYQDQGETKGKININTASLDELMSISGIGESKAKAIIDYREKNGLFESIEDITKVTGIGTSTFENLKEYITV